ncbi:hypothetical protein GF324_00305, partial [bacterium]|nr:hypothetical protein [bacterium]
MTSRFNTIRVGLSIRQKAVEFALHGRFQLVHDDGSTDPIREGRYHATVAEACRGPRWGLRLRSFQAASDAETFAGRARRNELPSEVHRLGRELRDGNGNDLAPYVWVVTAGDFQTEAQASAGAEELIAPHADNLGLRAYPDQWLQFDALRINRPEGGRVRIESENGTSFTLASPGRIEPLDEAARFELAEVRIGIDFHWDHVERLSFRGALDLAVDGEALTAVNEVDIESYLLSLLGSEMRSDWPKEALAAQAVAARSTILATRGRHHYGEAFDLC